MLKKKDPKTKYATAFTKFGVEFNEEIDGQYIADCPFSGKRNKLYVNVETGQWDSKSTGISGNLYSFMREMVQMCLEETTPVDLNKLARSRGLPAKAFKGRVVYNALSELYMIPEYNEAGKLSGVGHYKLGSKMVARTKTCKTTLNGLNKAVDNDLPIFICEGEWDWIALKWLHKEVGFESVCCCLPGAGTFKTEWLPTMQGRSVYTCYDNDNAGEKGELKAHGVLTGVVSNIKHLRWLPLHPNGYDTRDFILDNAHPTDTRHKAKKCRKTMLKMFNVDHRNSDNEPTKTKNTVETNNNNTSNKPKEDIIVPSRKELETGFTKWLEMTDLDPLAFMFGVCFANKIGGDPIWGFFVAPPGGMKTELVLTLSKSDFVETVSTLTPAALISGMRMSDGNDPSLIPKLNNRLLVVKDFTTVLSMNSFQRDEVFGILRDAYDGSIEKPYGNGLVRRYESMFGMLAGVTPTIDTFQAVHTSLGERFIKYRMDKDLMPETEEARLLKVLNNISKESGMRKELQELGRRYIEKTVDVDNLPTYSEKIAKQVMRCARFTAKLRSSVDRDKYSDAMLSIPTTEVATRLTKQYMKLAIGVAIYFDDKEVGENSMRVLRKVAIDTAPALYEVAVRSVFTRYRDTEERVSTPQILKDVPYCPATLLGVLRDLTTLRIIHKAKGSEGLKSFYVPSKNTLSTINGAKVYR